eukprot:EG_transcript_16584
MERVHVRFFRFSAFYTPLLLTIQSEALRRSGIQVTYDRVTPDRPLDAGLKDGSVQVGQSAPSLAFQAVLRREAPAARHFAVLNRRDGFFLVGRQPAHRPFPWRTLEGRTVLVDHFFQPHALFFTALRKQGVDVSRLTIVDAGSPDQIEAAFRAGAGDFAHLQGPAPQQIEADGLGHVVASVGEATGELYFSSLCAMPAWLRTPVAQQFFAAYRLARAAAHSGDPDDIARRIAGFLPEVSYAVLMQTIAAYQLIQTWAGEDRCSPQLYDTTVGVFRATGYIDARPAMDDIICEPPDLSVQ